MAMRGGGGGTAVGTVAVRIVPLPWMPAPAALPGAGVCPAAGVPGVVGGLLAGGLAAVASAGGPPGAPKLGKSQALSSRPTSRIARAGAERQEPRAAVISSSPFGWAEIKPDVAVAQYSTGPVPCQRVDITTFHNIQ